MFLRLIWESFARQRRRKLLAGLAILLGTTAVTAMLALATTIGDRIHRELAVYGANIVITPKAADLAVNIGDETLHPATAGALLHANDLRKLRTIFWANNLTAVSPELTLVAQMQPANGSASVPVQTVGYWFSHDLDGLTTGVLALHPLWRVAGVWPAASGSPLIDVAVGSTFAKAHNLQLGSTFVLNNASPLVTMQAHVVGIATTDSERDNTVFLRLEDQQKFVAPTSDAVDRVEVAARTRPEDAFARQDPATLSPKKRDVWYCRPYANSIAYQIREAIPGADAEQVRAVEQSEGTILERISGLLWLISAAALLAAAVAVSAAMATTVLERRAEIGLMRSLGASRGRVASLFYAEAALLALLAGLSGYVLGSLLAALLTAKIFGEPASESLRTALEHCFNPVLLPVVVGIALLIAIAGSTASIRHALRANPTDVLRGNA